MPSPINYSNFQFIFFQNVPSGPTVFDDAFEISKFKSKFRATVIRHTPIEMEIDLIGIHPAIANTFRRMMLSDVPTMAIDRIEIMNNTSALRDEVLAHRIGLIPLKADPRLFEFRVDSTSDLNETDALTYELKIKCTSTHKENTAIPEELYKNSNVYSKDIKWVPIGGQAGMLKDVGPVHDDILINKLRPGQEIDLKMIATKGVGKDHAKFSPVGTASYRILPEIHLTRDVFDEQAQRLQQCFAPGVIAIKMNEGKRQAYVADARYDTCSRNVFRYDDLRDAVVMSRIKDHFICKYSSRNRVAYSSKS